MSRDLGPYRRTWEEQGVVMDAEQMVHLRAAAARESRARAGVVAGALLVALGIAVAVLDAPGDGVAVALGGTLATVVMELSRRCWGAVLRGRYVSRRLAGVTAAAVVMAFVVMSLVVLAFVAGWPLPLTAGVVVVGVLLTVLLFMSPTLSPAPQRR